MAQSRLMVIAKDETLRHSLEFTLQAEGFAVTARPDITLFPETGDYGCLVLDETGLAGTFAAIAGYCERFPATVLLADRPDSPLRALARQVVSKPLIGGAVSAAVRMALDRDDSSPPEEQTAP